MKNKEMNAMESLGVILTSLLCIVIAFAFRGVAVMFIWNWFISKLGFPIVTLPLAIGVGIFITLFTSKKETKKEEPSVSFLLKSTWRAIYSNLIWLGIGYIVTLFM
jgi:hypothetical protein